MDPESGVVCEMDEGGVWVVRQRAARPRDRCCWRWLGILTFQMLVGTILVLALLYFQVIPSSKQGDLEHKKAESEQYKNPLPHQLKLQAMEKQKPAAHLIADLSQPRLKWITDKGYAFIQNGMELKDNKLVIPATGLYLVYTQVVYFGMNCRPKSNLYLVHTVHKYSEAYPKEKALLSATKTACEGPSHAGPWYETIYQGGVFNLEQGDILSTLTTEPAHLDSKSAQNYFGVIAM